jgi:hypothetical protein
MIDGIATGWQHAFFALGWLIGALPALFALALLVALLIGVRAATGALLEHRIRVYRLRRQTRRTGRAVADGDPYSGAPYYGDPPAQPFGCHCSRLPPGVRDLTGHEPGCPKHPATT